MSKDLTKTFDVPLSQVDESIAHYGVKGMKWGVHRDEAVLARLAGASGVRSTAPDRATRKAENRDAKQRWKDYKSSVSREELRNDRRKALESKISYLVEKADKRPDKTLLLLNAPSTMPIVITGREFIDHLTQGGAIAPAYTSIWAELED